MAGLVAVVTGSSEGSKSATSSDVTGTSSPNTSAVIADSSTQAVSIPVPTATSNSRLTPGTSKSVDSAPSPTPEKRNIPKSELAGKQPSTPNTTPPPSPNPSSSSSSLPLSSSGEGDAIPGKPENGYLGYEQIKQTRTQLDQTKLEVRVSRHY